MDYRRSVGELPFGGRLLGPGSVWRRRNEIFRARHLGPRSDSRHVCEKVLASFIHILYWREGPEGACKGPVRHQHQASQEPRGHRGKPETVHLALQHSARPILTPYRLPLHPEDSHLGDHKTRSHPALRAHTLCPAAMDHTDPAPFLHTNHKASRPGRWHRRAYLALATCPGIARHTLEVADSPEHLRVSHRFGFRTPGPCKGGPGRRPSITTAEEKCSRSCRLACCQETTRLTRHPVYLQYI